MLIGLDRQIGAIHQVPIIDLAWFKNEQGTGNSQQGIGNYISHTLIYLSPLELHKVLSSRLNASP